MATTTAIKRKPGEKDLKGLSPNQIAKRNLIIQAAYRIILREGVAGCTARAIAAESEHSTSALHYYFSDVDAIVDLAIARLMDRFFAYIEALIEQARDPVEALWKGTLAFFRSSSERPKDQRNENGGWAPMIWFEYQGESIKRGDTETACQFSERGFKLFERLVEGVGVENPSDVAEALNCAVVGATCRNSLFPRPAEEYVRLMIKTLGLPLPPSQEAKL